MPIPAPRRWLFAVPLALYAIALLALRAHLPTGDTPSLLVALLAGGLAIGAAVALVLRHRATLGRVSSRG